MVTASLPLGISLTLDQVDATVVASVLDSVRWTLSVAALNNPAKRTTLYAQSAYVPKRPQTSQDVPRRPKTSQRYEQLNGGFEASELGR
jgi:hypothetical protein